MEKRHCCQICGAYLNSVEQFYYHTIGNRHIDEVSKLFPVFSEGGFMKFAVNPNVPTNLTGHCCTLCHKEFNSRHQFFDHIDGKFHRWRVARIIRGTDGPHGTFHILRPPGL